MKKSVPEGTDFSCLNRSSLCQVAVKEGYDMCACACAVGNEGAVSGADGDAVFGCPEYCRSIHRAFANVGKRICDARRGTVLIAPQEGDKLSARYRCVRRERCVRCALDDAVFICPGRCLFVEAAGLYVGKRSVLIDLGSGLPAARQRKVTTCARVQLASGAKCVESTPFTMPLL